MLKMPAILMSCVLATSATAKSRDVSVDPGPAPASFEEFQRLATPVLLSGFFDPSAAQITWDRGLASGYWKPIFSKKIPGWFTCGLVNGKNRFGGYVGAVRFVAVYNQGRIVYTDVGQSGSFDLVGMGCQKAISDGLLPMAGQNRSPSLDNVPPQGPRLGIRFSVVPDGAYIRGVEPGGPAERAGIISGMVVSHVNGVPLKGSDEPTMAAIIRAPPKLTLTIIGKGDVVVEKSEGLAN